MESKEYFEKVMQDYNQNRKGRSLRKYCKDEAVDYDWLILYKKTYPLQEKKQEQPQDAFIPITIKDDAPKPTTWQVEKLVLSSLASLWARRWMLRSCHVTMFAILKMERMQRSPRYLRLSLDC